MKEQIASILQRLEQQRRLIQQRLVLLERKRGLLQEEKSRIDYTIAKLRGKHSIDNAPSDQMASGIEKEAIRLPLRLPRGTITSIIIEIIIAAGSRGVTVTDIVELANQRGVVLSRTSVATLVSKSCRDEVLRVENKRYKMRSMAPVD